MVGKEKNDWASDPLAFERYIEVEAGLGGCDAVNYLQSYKDTPHPHSVRNKV
jgi:hypothetical protein